MPRKKTKVTRDMSVSHMDPMEEDCEGDLLSSSLDHCILFKAVNKKVPIVPDVVISVEAQKGCRFPDTTFIIVNGTVIGRKALFDIGSPHNVIS